MTAPGAVQGRIPFRGSSISMAIPDPRRLYCRFIDHVVNHQRLDHLDQFLAADVVEHAPARTAGMATARETMAARPLAFPDLHLGIADLGVEGGRLMARLID